MWKKYLAYGFSGLMMGAVLALIGFADYSEVHKMFIFADFRMLFTFAGAVGLTMLVSLIFRRRFPRQNKIFQPGLLPGSMLFGFGWAITGACPSLVFVQLGQGYVPAVSTMFGIFIGVLLHRKLHGKLFRWDIGACNSA